MELNTKHKFKVGDRVKLIAPSEILTHENYDASTGYYSIGICGSMWIGSLEKFDSYPKLFLDSNVRAMEISNFQQVRCVGSDTGISWWVPIDLVAPYAQEINW